MLINELRSYSEQVERTRIAYIELLEAVQRGRIGDRERRLACEGEQLRANRSAHELDGDFTALLSETTLNQVEKHAVELYLPVEIASRLFGHDEATELSHHLKRSLQERVTLDQAWARVRPLLDDMIEIRVVTALRAHRHELRYLLEEVTTSWLIFQESLPLAHPSHPSTGTGDGTVRRRELVDALFKVIRFADAWNNMVGSVRASAARTRRFK